MTLSVLVTIDTESYSQGHPDQHIWGRTADGQEHGIRAIMDILERHGVRGTFYVNVYEAGRHGEEALREVVRAIDERGHEVGLHTHPRDLYGVEKLTRADVPRQMEILAWGQHFIEAATGKPVLAHRAGAFAANLKTIEALGKLGVEVDASLSPAWFESHLAREVESGNRPMSLGGLLELPVTYYVQARLGSREFQRMIDIEACSLRELKTIVRQAQAQEAGAINLLMHSHSFALAGAHDRTLVKRLDAFLRFLATQPGAQATTTAQFFEQWRTTGTTAPVGQPFVPYTGWWTTYLRTVESIGRGWKNTAAALAPPIALAALAAAAGALYRSA
ncbi:MAG: polysaccharide deacetylase family protein [Betaproteobacteria bacterium]|nr:polysaccharide deacetylase family protein [Betaproteobacteria bacterium]